jgi:hypothetical protein
MESHLHCLNLLNSQVLLIHWYPYQCSLQYQLNLHQLIVFHLQPLITTQLSPQLNHLIHLIIHQYHLINHLNHQLHLIILILILTILLINLQSIQTSNHFPRFHQVNLPIQLLILVNLPTMSLHLHSPHQFHLITHQCHPINH